MFEDNTIPLSQFKAEVSDQFYGSLRLHQFLLSDLLDKQEKQLILMKESKIPDFYEKSAPDMQFLLSYHFTTPAFAHFCD